MKPGELESESCTEKPQEWGKMKREVDSLNPLPIKQFCHVKSIPKHTEIPTPLAEKLRDILMQDGNAST